VPKKVKKTQVRVNVAGNEIIQSFDGESLKGLYKQWKTDASNIGNLGITGDVTVLNLLEGHGIVGRGGVGSAVDDTGAGGIIEVLDKVLLSGDLITEKEKIELEDVFKDLTYAEANNNPKDTPFRVPVYDSYNKKSGKWEWETVHGHYRTPGYVQKRTLPTEEGGDGSENELDPVPAEYFNGQPPMWKALFGSGGFKEITKGVMDVLPSAEVSIPMLNVRQAGAAEAIIKVEAVARTIKKKLLGDDFRKQDGTYDGNRGRNALQTIQFKGGKQDDLIKDAAGIEDIEGDVAGYKLNVTPMMMRKIAVSLGFNETPESSAGAETKEDIGKSWTEILKAKRCPKCGSPMKRKGKGWRKQVGEWYCPKCGSKSANFKSRWAGPRTPTPTSHRGKEVFE